MKLFKNKENKTNNLKVIIVGAGKVGVYILSQLVLEGHDVTLVDSDPKRIDTLSEMYDVYGVVGNGASHKILLEAGIENTDIVIAVTGSDELNLLCCTIARRASKCATIARVRNPEYSDEIDFIREQLGLALVINPEYELAREASRIISLPTALDVYAFGNGRAELVKFKLTEDNILVNTKIMELKNKISVDNVLICAIERDDDIYIPSGDFTLLAGDVIYVVSSRKYIRSFFKGIGMVSKKVHRVLLIGGGKASYYLAKQLIDMNIQVKIIENKKERANELSGLLPKAEIVLGDGTDTDLLYAEGIESFDAVLPLTNIDEENVMLTLFARKVSDAKVITRINRIGFKNVISDLDLGSVIYPKSITSESILRFVRAKSNSKENVNIEALYQLFDAKAEAVEFKISSDDTRVTGKKLMELKIKKNILVAYIRRQNTIIIPNGQDSINENDSVMVVTSGIVLNSIEDILEA